MRIDVTAELIAQGTQGTCGFCAMSLAFERATGVQWFVTLTHARPLMSSIWDYKPLPPEARAWIADYDAGKVDAQPISFEFPWEPVAA